ncbi:MAG: oligosaccharide flippase family protein [Pseudomonadota bacterium]
MKDDANKRAEKSHSGATKQAAGRIFRNSRKLIGGKAVGGLLSLAYLGIAARSLGPEQMGYLVLAHAYVLLIARVARFQSWQAVIRFGTPLIANGDETTFRTLIRFTVKLDLLSAVGSVFIAVGFLGIVANLMGWPAEARSHILAYCLATPFLIAATPTGVLQLFNRFTILSWQLTLTPIVRLVGALILWRIGGGLTEFLIVWIASIVLDGAVLWALGWRELTKRRLMPGRRGDAKASREWLPFMIKTNLSSTVDQVQAQLPLLIVGAVLGSAASGFLKLAVNMSNLIAQPANMLNQATYPELSKIYAERGLRPMRAVAVRSAAFAMLVATPFTVLYFLFGNQLATIVGGSAFAPAGVLIGLMAFSQLWRIASVILESAVLAIGRAGYVLVAQCASAVTNIAILAAALAPSGVIAAPIAIIAGWAALIVFYIFRLNRLPPKKNLS